MSVCRVRSELIQYCNSKISVLGRRRTAGQRDKTAEGQRYKEIAPCEMSFEMLLFEKISEFDRLCNLLAN